MMKETVECRWRRVCLSLILLHHQMKLTESGGVSLGVVMRGEEV
jgi:hypothetical protein